jgi:hypothetical protein
MSAKKTPSVCANCKFAEWDKTASGRLHPSGGGLCKWTVSIPFARHSVVYSIRSDIRGDRLVLRGTRIERWKSRFTIGEEMCAVKEPAQ